MNEPFDTIERIGQSEQFDEASVVTLRQLTETFPEVPELWDFFGDVIQLAHAGSSPRSEALRCYQNAIRCDPEYWPALESLGYYHDLEDKLAEAEHYFRLSLEHGAGDSARIGLARVLAQQGDTDRAITQLWRCKDQTRESLLELRREITDGLWTPDED